MALQRFGFIVAGPGLDPATHRSTLGSPQFTMLTVGIGHPSQGPAVAKEMLASGVQLIELCGAFGPSDTARVQHAIAHQVPVGAVSYGSDSIAAMHRLFAD